MNTHSYLRQRLFALVVAGACLIPFGATVRAQDSDPPTIIQYTPTIQSLGGLLPFTTTTTIAVQSPSTLTPGVPVAVTFGADIAVVLGSPVMPPGATLATARSYASVSPAGVTFTGPGQTQLVTVTLTMPANTIPGLYSYKVLATGFSALPGGSIENLGSFINATVSSRDPGVDPPDVAIETPVSGAVVALPVGTTFPVSLPFSFAATAGGANPKPILSVAAFLFPGDPLVVGTQTGIGTVNAAGSGSMLISAPGTYRIAASATNEGGTATDEHTFTVSVAATSPTVVIDTPAAGAVFPFRLGGDPAQVPIAFTARSGFGGIRTLTAKVDGVTEAFSPLGIGTLTATGSFTKVYSLPGLHTVEVTTTDDFGTATAVSSFSVVAAEPNPAITITNPTAGQTFVIPSGQTTTSVPYAFVTTANNGFVVNSVGALRGSTPVSGVTTLGLGTATANSTGTLAGLASGPYTLTATGTSAGVSVTTSTSFWVVRITNPVDQTVSAFGTATFAASASLRTDTSYTYQWYRQAAGTTGFVLLTSSATYGNTSGTYTTSANLNLTVSGATVPMTNDLFKLVFTSAGGVVYETTAAKLTVTAAAPPQTVSGAVYLDVNRNAVREAGEVGLGGITVKIYQGSTLYGTTSTSLTGAYTFQVVPGTYEIDVIEPRGLTPTDSTPRIAIVNAAAVTVREFGLTPSFNVSALAGLRGEGMSQGYWSSNIGKALSNKPRGMQESPADLLAYTTTIADGLALSPFDGLTMTSGSALAILNGKDQLPLQLLAAEYNYVSGRLINGNVMLTHDFILWGEYVLKYRSSFPASYQNFVKDWMDAFNNSHGGLIKGPTQ